MSGKVLNIPNGITIGRLLMIPVLVVVMSFIQGKAAILLSFASAAIVSIAMASDCVDGYYARRYGLVSTFGKFLDPLADKLLFLAAMIMLVQLDRMPGWIVIAFLAREMMVTALRGVAVDRGIIIQASRLGKYKSAFISAGTVGLLLHFPFLGADWRLMGWMMLIPGFLLSMVSGGHYIFAFFKAVGEEETSVPQ